MIQLWSHLPMAWYLQLIVVGWCSTRISPSNSQHALGLSLGDTITIPLRIVDLLIWNIQIKITIIFPRMILHLD